ncbi:putative DnaJ-domain-containing protein [Seiridium unicorne]|uniref:DnaJ-domain-containing protein n=1 Tax=Seiridium unicorne TaxID=138068 RepID=A0ABR2VIG3_9PEZI
MADSGLSHTQCCAILGLQAGASTGHVKQAFRALALIYHPDKAGADEERKEANNEKFKELRAAYEVLINNMRVGQPTTAATDFESRSRIDPAIRERLEKVTQRYRDLVRKIGESSVFGSRTWDMMYDYYRRTDFPKLSQLWTIRDQAVKQVSRRVTLLLLNAGKKLGALPECGVKEEELEEWEKTATKAATVVGQWYKDLLCLHEAASRALSAGDRDRSMHGSRLLQQSTRLARHAHVSCRF